jgi:hypothetical protein
MHAGNSIKTIGSATNIGKLSKPTISTEILTNQAGRGNSFLLFPVIEAALTIAGDVPSLFSPCPSTMYPPRLHLHETIYPYLVHLRRFVCELRLWHPSHPIYQLQTHLRKGSVGSHASPRQLPRSPSCQLAARSCAQIKPGQCRSTVVNE